MIVSLSHNEIKGWYCKSHIIVSSVCI